MKVAKSLKAVSRNDKENFSRGDKFSVNPRSLIIREGYNVRNLDEMTDEDRAGYDAYVDALAVAYATGQTVPSIIVRVIDGKVVVSEGHTRHKGMMRAIEVYGASLERVTVEEFKGNDAQERALMATSQNNRKLRALELAKVYKGLADEDGMSDEEIAKMVGQTVDHVTRYKAYATMPAELQSFVNLNRMSVTVAMELFTKHGDNVVNVAAGKINSAKKGGKKKVTAGMALPKFTAKQRTQVNTATAKIYDAVKDVDAPEQGDVQVTMSAELVRLIQELGPKAEEILAAQLKKDKENAATKDEEQVEMPLSQVA